MASADGVSVGRVPGDRYRWVVLAVGTAAQATVSIVLFSVAVLAPELRSEFGLSLAETGVVLAAAGLGMTPALLPWGLLTDRLGERVVLPLGLGLAAPVLARVGSAASLPELVILLALAGALIASANAASGRAVMQWFAASERGLALGIRQSSVPLGGLVAAVALPALAAATGLGTSYVAIGAACGLGAMTGAILLRSPVPEKASPRRRQGGHRVLRYRGLWIVSFAGGLLIFSQTATMSFTVLFLNEARGFSTHTAALVFACSQVVGMVLRIVVGLWSDRRGTRVAPLRILALAIAGSMAAIAAVATCPLWLLVPVIVIAGGIAMSWNGLAFTSAAEIAGVEAAGAAIGLQQTMLGLAGIVAPVAFAAVVSSASWALAFLAAALFPILAWALLRPLTRSSSRGQLSRARAVR